MTGQIGGGRLDASVHFRGADIDAVELHLHRPLQVLAGLHGRPVDECLRLLPLLFPLCGTAHALSALQAVEAALHVELEPAQRVARTALAMADATAAHVWRTCIDWPQLLDRAVDATQVARARRLVAQIAAALYPGGDWRRVGGGGLNPDPEALANARAELAELRGAFDLATALSASHRGLRAALAGAGDEWLPRLAAGFDAMADAAVASFDALDAQLRALPDLRVTSQSFAAATADSGRGSGSAETARGELRYRVDIAAGHVAACSMIAPTDRAFADHGPVAQLLQQLKRADQPLLAVRWILAAFDPCIEVRIEAAGDG
jgi:coenzyme F420-reducing hydrogenase alpha subunit